ncbi:Zinc finger CCHC domain-containing protein [Quillaja saponaria]|uniref:Zinc finger CCHC domain-containing protein n=1 Tax=Quillaja saponaria TaxID=32244 RepID=A0AAD7M4R9_QUISA|nr:Zinc finger CCHC domain-containing protein [Quillaja saponaria]
MVSKRQIIARKRFKEEHPDLFPKPEPTPPEDPNKNKKKKQSFSSNKRKNHDSETLNVSKNPFKKGYRNRPLRVPGMKPGDCCFICKSQEHIAKLCPEKAQWEKNKICLLCRQRGHRVNNCPNGERKTEKFCYNCGGKGHSLDKCPQPLQDGGTKFANCFVCNQRGHLSKNCPQNAHGIYPKGGCCKICGGVTHLAKDCPDKGNKRPVAANEWGYTSMKTEERPQLIKFVSGDDLGDDFMADDKLNGGAQDKPKKKQGFEVDPASNSKNSGVVMEFSLIGSLGLIWILMRQKKKKNPIMVSSCNTIPNVAA